MRSVTQLVIDTIALEVGGRKAGVAPGITLDELVRRVWDRNWKTLQTAGFSREDLGGIAGGVWTWAEACGWPSLLQLITSTFDDEVHPSRRKISLQGWPAPFTLPRAGTLELPSGRWAWLAPQRGDNVRVSFQHLHHPRDRMESAIAMAEFSARPIDQIAREPSVRWWQDDRRDVTWEIRTNPRLIPLGSRDISFSHVALGSRSALLPQGARLGELTDEQLGLLLLQAEAAGQGASERSEPRSASA